MKPWGTQRVLIDEILTGLREGQHQFLILKAGQVGATLAMHLLTVYWCLRYPGMQGALVADSDEVRNYCRDNLLNLNASAPEVMDTRLSNKDMLAWVNGSRLTLQTAGPRSGRKLGIGRGVALIHGTEVPLWGLARAMTYLRTRFSDAHPQRLAVFEGTARGKNWFFDEWQDSVGAADIRRVFLGWWMREDNTLSEKSDIFKQYWDGRLSSREKFWAKEIDRRWHQTLTDGQWAWRRWFLAEKAGGDEQGADQEQPTLPEDAFEATGITFLTQDALRTARRSVAAADTPERWRYEWGSHFEETSLRRTIPGRDVLQIWEKPLEAEAYVVAAVPAHSRRRRAPTTSSPSSAPAATSCFRWPSSPTRIAGSRDILGFALISSEPTRRHGAPSSSKSSASVARCWKS